MVRILLVEDDPDARPLLEGILRSRGYHVTIAESMASATAILGSQPFDLLVCYVNLRGQQCADRCRHDEDYRRKGAGGERFAPAAR